MKRALILFVVTAAIVAAQISPPVRLPAAGGAGNPGLPSSIVLDGAVTRMASLNPLMRNSNSAGTFDEIKIGPRRLIRTAVGTYRAYAEAVSGTGSPTPTDASFWTSSDGGVWALDGSNPIIDAPAGGWNNNEFSPTAPVWDPVNQRWVILGHGGNNGVQRVIGLYVGTDGTTGRAFTNSGVVLPILAGSWEDVSSGISDPKVEKFSNSNWRLLYATVNVPGKKMGLAVSTDQGATWTKNPNNPVIVSNGATWNVNGVGPAASFVDSRGRWHIWAVGYNASDLASNGYYYSDNQGVTWTQGSNNPVWQGTGNTADPDWAIGDTNDALDDGDKLIITTAGFNFSSYAGPGGVPLRGVIGGYLPLKAIGIPATPARFFQAGGYVSIPVAATLLTETVFTILVRFRALKESTSREFYSEALEFNKQIFFRLNTTGTITSWFRTPTAIAAFNSVSRYDDNLWRVVLFVRTATAAFEAFIRTDTGSWASLGTDTANPGTTTAAAYIAFGNWHQSAGIADEPQLGSISHVLTIKGTALSTAQADTFMSSAMLPGGVTAAVIYYPGQSGSATSETDQSGNGRNGTVVGTTIVNGAASAGITPLN